MTTLEIDTPQGPARAHLHPAEQPLPALLLGHGAGGGVNAPDLLAVTEAAGREGFSVALIEQPYRVAGRRSSPRTPRLDAAWKTVVEHLRADQLLGLPLVFGGRSAGARVACRTAGDCGAVAVLCLAFPLHPPRRNRTTPPKTRQPELDAVRMPTLVVQGDRDPYGVPPAGPNREVVTVRGDHSLKRDLEAVATAVQDWLRRLLD